MKKIRHISLITLFMLTTSIGYGQNQVKDVLSRTNRPSRDDIRIQIKDGSYQTHLPVSIIKGNNGGPIFTIIAGVHGYEYPPIIALQELMKEINEEKLSGTLIIIPIANIPSFYGRSSFVNPMDKVNLNRIFPGNPNGSITEKIADLITKDIISVSDIVLDIHGGDAGEDLLPFVCYYNNKQKPRQTKLAKQLAENSGFNYVVSYPYTLDDDQPAKYAFKQAVQDGKTALSIEAGKLGNVQPEAVVAIRLGVLRIMEKLNMYKIQPQPKKDLIRLNEQVYIRSKYQGIFYSNLRAGNSLKEGEVVGEIRNEFGKLLTELKAPHSGTILYKIGTPPVNTGETIMCIGYE